MTSETDWPTYNGDPGGNRYTTLTQIDKTDVARLAPRWMFTRPDAGMLQVTPVVVDGIMYVTAPNECVALDAGSGRRIWHYKRPRTKGVHGGDANRGVAVAGDRVFMVTDHAHLIALNRFTGELLWDIVMDDWRKNYAASSAPLVAGDLVMSGVSGGEHGANGFVAAFDQATGKEVWRFWTVPKPGEPGSETWDGKDIEHGGAPTWFTGSYDPSSTRCTGRPAIRQGVRRRRSPGRQSLRALHPRPRPEDRHAASGTTSSRRTICGTGTRRRPRCWSTPTWQGQPRTLLLHANRNGFFYVFDRRDGERLLSTPFVKNLTWASGIGADGRPVRLPDQEPSPEGTKVCPSQDGATNWFSPSFNPPTGLYYVQTFEKCSIYTKRAGALAAGKPYLGGSQRIRRPTRCRSGSCAPSTSGRARSRWELPQPGPAISWGGTLAPRAAW